MLSVTYSRRAELSAGVAFNAELRGGVATLRTMYVNADDAETNYEPILREAASADVVIVGSYVNITSETATADAPRDFVKFLDTLRLRGARMVLVSFGSPYVLQQTPAVEAYAIAWGGSNASQRAAARALVGSRAITGTLPISIPPLLSIRAGLRRDVK